MSTTENPFATQRASAMPFQRYEPYQQQFPISLPDRIELLVSFGEE